MSTRTPNTNLVKKMRDFKNMVKLAGYNNSETKDDSSECAGVSIFVEQPRKHFLVSCDLISVEGDCCNGEIEITAFVS